ncbi:methyltransferase domain-containing protein [Nisaea sp.]|uniref:class I SAM-dependent methyltransferase n=1 Tax=Nisaea sp. TaxID=2024842 RepID=UPI0032EDFAFB
MTATISKKTNNYRKFLHSWYGFLSNIGRINLEGSQNFTENKPIREAYEARGYVAFSLTHKIGQALLGYFDSTNTTQFSNADCTQNFLSENHDDKTVSMLNENLIFFGPPQQKFRKLLKAIIGELAETIETAIGSPFKVTNVRAWVTNPDSSNYGPTAMHADGLSRYVRKVMIYPMPPNEISGTIEIVGRDGKPFILNSLDTPMALLADVGVLQHRGIPPKGATARPAIEVTLIPSLKTELDMDATGQNSRVPFLSDKDFDELAELFRTTQERELPWDDARRLIDTEGRAVNIGGGVHFDYPGWINLDEFSPRIPWRMSFSPSVRLPIKDAEVPLVYSSHCFEHLSDATVHQLLSEAYRVLKLGGQLVVKLPSFDRVLEQYLDGTSSGILEPKQWGLPALFDMWKRRGVSPGITSYASMIFCGFWNKSYGMEFNGDRGQRDSEAYHGPACISEEQADRILRSSTSPHFIAAQLKSEVLRSEEGITFNHQNAWSFEEFVAVALIHGFERADEGDVVTAYREKIPTLELLQPISNYFVFTKKP